MSYKYETMTGTVSSVEDAYSALEELGGECREIVDNAPEGLNQTDRIQTFEESASTLEYLSTPDVPECVRDLAISYSYATPRRKRQSTSRAVRRDNELAVVQAAVAALEEWLEDEANAEHDDRDEVETFKDQLESDASDIEGCEFPGMFG